MSGPHAGSYDPVKGIFLSPVRGESDSGEPTTASWVEYCRRHVRFMHKQSMDANREQLSVKQQVSRNLIVFRCRRDSRTKVIQVDMKFSHRGIMWNIVGVDPVDYSQDEVQFLAESVRTPVTWTPA